MRDSGHNSRDKREAPEARDRRTRPKGTRLPGVCIKIGNKDDKVGE